jgi:hypothetical protein
VAQALLRVCNGCRSRKGVRACDPVFRHTPLIVVDLVVERSFQMIQLNEAKQKARLAANDMGSLLEDELGVLAAVAFD